MNLKLENHHEYREDLLLATLSSCHMLTYLALCVRQSIAAPSTIVMLPSCPQACMTPAFSEEKGTPDCSSMARASRQARSAMVGPAFSPRRRLMTPVPPMPVVTSSPRFPR